MTTNAPNVERNTIAALDVAERSGAIQALSAVTTAATRHVRHTCRPADCLREVIAEAASALGLPEPETIA